MHKPLGRSVIASTSGDFRPTATSAIQNVVGTHEDGNVDERLNGGGTGLSIMSTNWFKYSCFISYRHGQRREAERIIRELYDALSEELDFWMSEGVFLDLDRLKGGDFYNETLARALCRSVCMIMIFTPRYFDQNSVYCAREFKAMLDLESQRMQMLAGNTTSGHGLIIPIVCRGKEYLPAIITSSRQYYDFEMDLTTRQGMKTNAAKVKIKNIAAYIKARHSEFRDVLDLCAHCQTYELPGEDEVRLWMSEQNIHPGGIAAGRLPGR